MKSMALLLLTLLILFFTGCGPNIIIMDDYKGKTIESVQLNIVKNFDRPAISNSDDVADDLGKGDPVQVFQKFFDSSLERQIKGTGRFTGVKIMASKPEMNLISKSFKFKDDEYISFRVPNYPDSAQNILPGDFTLFIESLMTYRYAGSAGSFNGKSFSGGEFASLRMKADYFIWDNKNKKIVAYSSCELSSTVVFAMTKQNWEGVVSGLVSYIFGNPPFSIPNLRY